MARNARARGKRIAFGDGSRIIWDKHSAEVFRGNPNVAKPGSEQDQDIEWVAFHKGHRVYNRQHPSKPLWMWNMQFRPTPGEMFLATSELRNGRRFGGGFVVIEPNVPWWKSVAPNKDWGQSKYQAVADRLRAEGRRVVQFVHQQTKVKLTGVEHLRTINFRDAMAVMEHAALYIGPEGGMHHGAAAMGRKAVVLFGGFIPPEVTGYPDHANLTGGAEACGMFQPCAHCRKALDKITAEEVIAAATEKLSG